MSENQLDLKNRSLVDKLIGFCLINKLVVLLVTLAVIGWGIIVAPFDWKIRGIERNPVAVDAIPDIGENQQIVFTEWMGRSPKDIENQITYPLTSALLGVPGVKTVRSFSMFGFSSVYVIFKEDVEFYWSRSRILEKLNSLPPGTLPEGVRPALGPDATPLGQVFLYTLEGRDSAGNATGGWDLNELRSAQDWLVRFSLLSAEGVAEVASLGGFVKEYQIDVNPDALRSYGIALDQVFDAIKMSNMDVGARTIEINQVDYTIRGIGFIKSLGDVEQIVLKEMNNVPVKIKDVATVGFGPAMREGVLDKEGTEAVGGVVVARYGANPLEVITNVKNKIKEIEPGLPRKTLANGTVSQLTVVPYYDRSGLIYETLGTLNAAITEEILITIIVVLVMVMHFQSSIMISGLLPLAVLLCFIAMKFFKVDANIVALSGIAIAIGEMVDMGIIFTENMLKHLNAAPPNESRLKVIFNAASEVGSAVLTAMSTTLVSFLTIFAMTGAEGKLFKPLAYTKTFAMVASLIVALTIIPPVAHILFTKKVRSKKLLDVYNALLIAFGVFLAIYYAWWAGLIVALFGIFHFVSERISHPLLTKKTLILNGIAIIGVTLLLTSHWMPLGLERGLFRNLLFAGGAIAGIFWTFHLFQKNYSSILPWMLDHRKLFFTGIGAIVMWGFLVWLGFPRLMGFIPDFGKRNFLYQTLAHEFPGIGKEFMPPLDEGSYLFMPTTMPHASIGASKDILQKQDMAIHSIPEVESVVGKVGRADSPLDPAPLYMVETIISYKSEYKQNLRGQNLLFKYDKRKKEFIRDEIGNLIPDKRGKPFRQWRDSFRKPDDIWNEIVRVAKVPGSTSAPRLQPIIGRIVMLQSGMRAPMGVKVKGPDLETIEKVGLVIERSLKEVPAIEASSVVADRIVGKPYIEIKIDRPAIARYGLRIDDVQQAIEVAIGGVPVTTTVEGRERYPVRVRYPRELRTSPEALERIMVPTMNGAQIPLTQLAQLEYVNGPQEIKAEDTFLVGYILFDMKSGFAEVDVVEHARAYLNHKMKTGELVLPAGTSFTFAGNYENQVRAMKKMRLIIPLSLLIIFLLLYFQFHSVTTSIFVFAGIFVAWSGGFILLYLYGKAWFFNFAIFGANLRDLFQIHPINLSIAVWVGFLALFGIASDDGVLMATYLDQSFAKRKMSSIAEIRLATLEGAQRRLRPCLMTTATTILALLPVLTSTGRGSDIVVPMAIPSFGGMLFELLTLFVVPVSYSMVEEYKLKKQMRKKEGESAPT